MTRAAIWISSVAILLSSSGLARADSASSADKAVAESLFQDGRKLMASGDFEQACAKLTESHRLVARLGTLLNLATCHEKQGKSASAWAEFTEAAAIAKRDRRKDREKYARDHAAALEKKLSRVVFELESPAEQTVLRLDGDAIGSAVWGTPLPVDPGSHRVEVSAPGRKIWSKSLEIAPGPTTLTVRVPALDELPPEPGATKSEPPAARPRERAPEADPESGGSAQRTLGFVALGVGAVGLGVGSYFGLQTFSKQAQSEDHCTGSVCNQQGVDLRDQAKSSATISTIGFAAGAASIGVGIVLLVTAGGNDATARKAQSIWLAPGIGSLSVGGRL
jgi:hypothetical protein